MKNNKFFYGDHFEALGYLWDGIYGNVEDFIKEQLNNTIKESSFYFEKKITKTRYGVFLYDENDYFKIMHFLKRKKLDSYHISSCPVLAGAKNKLVLKKRYTWQNNIEGVFAAESMTANKLLLNFFDPFYALDKERYNHNIRKNVYLSAVALNALELKEEDHIYTEGNYYEQCLKEFLEKNPNKTEKDFSLKIQMRAEHFRMFVHRDTTCVYEIVGLIEDIKYTKILGKKTAVLKVNLEHRKDKEFLYINLYVGEQLLKKYKPKKNKGIVAVIWLNGYFEDNLEKRKTNILSILSDNVINIIMVIMFILVYILSALGY